MPADRWWVERGDPSASHSLSSSLYAREPEVCAIVLVRVKIGWDVPNGRDVEDAVPYGVDRWFLTDPPVTS